jgi:TonB family protein
MKTKRIVGAIVTVCVLASTRASVAARQDDGQWPPPGVYAVVPGNGVTLPRLVREVRPQYTSDAMSARISGTVVLGCVVELDGTVGAIRVLRSLDAANGLDEQAIKAAKQWRFQPGTKDGVVVPVAVTIDLTFTLGSGSAPVLSWPESFAAAPTPDDKANARIDDDVDASGLRIHVSLPATWSLRKNETAGRLLVAVSSGGRGTRFLGIEQPQEARFRLTQPVTPVTLERVAEVLRQGVARVGADAQARAVGQGRASGRLWVWYEMWLPAADVGPNTPAEIASLLRATTDGVRVWMFMTTEGEREIRVSCFALKPHVATDGQWLDEIRQAGAEFSTIIRRISIQPQ